MMRKNHLRRGIIFLLGVSIVGLCGCGDSEENNLAETQEQADTTVATATSIITTSATQETSEEVMAIPEPDYTGIEVVTWELPEGTNTVESACYHDGCVYLLCTMDGGWTIYASNWGVTSRFTAVLSEDVGEIIGFDVGDDGKIYVLVEQNEAEMLLTLAGKGQIEKRTPLSGMIDGDVAYTGVECDASGNIYLTARLAGENCLCALDAAGNICSIQGNSGVTITLDDTHYLTRGGADGVMLWERSEGRELVLYRLEVTAGALWKTQVTMIDTIGETATPTRQSVAWSGYWDEAGIWCVREKEDSATLLYAWDDLGIDYTGVEGVILVEDDGAFIWASDAGAIHLLSPTGIEDAMTNENKEAGNSDEVGGPVPVEVEVEVATPVTEVEVEIEEE